MSIETDTAKQAIFNSITNPNTDIRNAECTQLDTARMFAAMNRENIRYVEDRGCFCCYDGSRWRMDDRDSTRVHELVQTFVETAAKWFGTSAGFDKDKEKFFLGYDARGRREQLVKDIKSQGFIKCVSSDFDKQKNLLNVKNGTLNLDTGELSPHKADDMIMMIANVEYHPEAKAERFEKFMGEIMSGDQEMVSHLQDVLGYALSGYTDQERFFILYGASTRNGKGTLNETILKLMGDYGKSAKYESFQESYYRNSGGAPSEDIARLQGARYVSVSEPAQTMVLDVAKVKTLTGGDTITARYLHQGSFEYQPQGKIFINTNHLPVVPDDTLFMSDRVEVILFDKHFNLDERDHDLKETLVTESEKSGILNWLIEGYQRVRAAKYLPMPKAVQLANQQYQAENDKVMEFVSEEMEQNSNSMVTLKEFYHRFSEWCLEAGYKALNRKNVKKHLSEKGLVRVDHNQDKVIGYKFLSDEKNNPFKGE